YTVIENGDAEELWYAPRFVDEGRATRAADILATHSDVYDVLAELHQAGRYFRTRGNHDGFWVLEGASSTLLADRLRTRAGAIDPNAPPFVVWDVLVIPGVLTMDESYPFQDVASHAFGSGSAQGAVDVLFSEGIDDLPIGLTPERYRQKAPLVIF